MTQLLLASSSQASRSGPADPYFSNVVLLMHGDTLSDKIGGTVALTGAVVNSTTQSKVGTKSIYVPSSGSFNVTPSVASAFTFGTGDMTIEFWMYYTNNTGSYQYPLSNGLTSPQEIQMRFGDSGFGTKYQCAFALDGQVSYLINSNYTNAQLVNGWHHYALTRKSGTAYVFVDGVLQNSAARAQSFTSNTTLTFMSVMIGYIQEIRVTKGVCRYSASFTPSTTRFPDH